MIDGPGGVFSTSSSCFPSSLAFFVKGVDLPPSNWDFFGEWKLGFFFFSMKKEPKLRIWHKKLLPTPSHYNKEKPAFFRLESIPSLILNSVKERKHENLISFSQKFGILQPFSVHKYFLITFSISCHWSPSIPLKTLKNQKYRKRPIEWNELTLFRQMSHFYTPWKRQKSKGFLTFSGGIEMGHWRVTSLSQGSLFECCN